MTPWRVHRFLPLRSPNDLRPFAMTVSLPPGPERSMPISNHFTAAPEPSGAESRKSADSEHSRLPAWAAPEHADGRTNAPREETPRTAGSASTVGGCRVRVQADGRLPCDGLSDGCLYARGVTVFRAAVRARATESTHAHAGTTEKPRNNHAVTTARLLATTQPGTTTV